MGSKWGVGQATDRLYQLIMKERVQELRQNMTSAENRMWYYLRSRRLGGYKFVRQQAIDNYIVDFVCREKKN